MKITAQDILDLLPIVADRGWYINGNGAIRDAEGFCPVCALAGAIDTEALAGRCLAWTSGHRLGLDSESIDGVAYAADLRDHRNRLALRHALGMA